MSGTFGQLHPVELEILPRREMAVAAVVFARDKPKLAQLARRKRAVRNGDPHHVGMELEIESVHQPQRLELVLGELARQPARHLAAELFGALVHQPGVEFVVAIHQSGLLAEVGTDRRSRGADRLAGFHRYHDALSHAHIEQIGRHDFALKNPFGGALEHVFGLGVRQNFGVRKVRDPSLRLVPIDDLAGAQAIGGEHLGIILARPDGSHD